MKETSDVVCALQIATPVIKEKTCKTLFFKRQLVIQNLQGPNQLAQVQCFTVCTSPCLMQQGDHILHLS